MKPCYIFQMELWKYFNFINFLVLVNNVLKEYEEMKEEIKNVKISPVHQRF